MKLTVTIVAGAYRLTDRDIIMRAPYREQPGDLIVQVSVDDIGNRPYSVMLHDMLRAAEASLDRQLRPATINREEGPQ